MFEKHFIVDGEEIHQNMRCYCYNCSFWVSHEIHFWVLAPFSFEDVINSNDNIL